jgi:DNA-binding transcriptional regulator YiaG
MEQPNERMAAIGRMIATMRQARSMTQQQFAQTVIGITLFFC